MVGPNLGIPGATKWLVFLTGSPFPWGSGTQYIRTSIFDEYLYDPEVDIKYAINVQYSNAEKYGMAIGASYVCPPLGDLNGDATTGGSYNVLDIVLLANCVLTQSCDSDCIWEDAGGNACGGSPCNACYGCAADLNGDDGYNVLDIVILANCVLAGNCDG